MNTYTTNLSRSTVCELVLAAQTGDRQAQGELFDRYQSQVMGIALRRLGNYAEAQELCQEVFMQALLKLTQLREPACFAGWLRSIANRMAINRGMRRAPSFATEPQTMESTCVEPNTPLASALSAERADEVRCGLDRLRQMDRETLVAFYVNGKSLLEMSDHFEAPVGTIKRRLHTARKRLAEEIEDRVAV